MKLHTGDRAAQAVSARIAAPAATTTALKAIPADRREDGMVCCVLADSTLWVFDADSSATASATVLAPDVGTGRWLTVGLGALTGTSPLTILPAALQWASDVTSPTLTQASSSTASGQELLIASQSSSLAAGNGGNLRLLSGAGGASGNGGHIVLDVRNGVSQGVVLFNRAGSTALTLTPVPSGTTVLTFAQAVTGVAWNHTAASAANGAAHTFSAQSTTRTDASATGGDLTLTSGSATGTHGGTNTSGLINLNIGNAANGGTNTFGSVRIQKNGTSVLTFSGGSSALSGSMTWASNLTSVTWASTATSVANGVNHTFSAQSTTLATGTASGGDLTLAAGSATGAATTNNAGSINLRTGDASGAGTNNIGALRLQQGSSSVATWGLRNAGANSLTWESTVTSFAWAQVSTSVANGASHSFSAQSTTLASGTVTAGDVNITAGAATGAATTNTGGSVILSAGSAINAGTNTRGTIQLKSGPTATVTTFGNAGLQLGGASNPVALTSGTVTLTQSQYMFPLIKLTGTLSGNVTVVLPATEGGNWIVDATAVVLGGNTITLQANGNNWGTTIGTTTLYKVAYGGTGRLYGTALAA